MRCDTEPGRKHSCVAREKPPWHPSILGLSPDPEVAEQKKSYVVYLFPGKTREKGVYTNGPEGRVYTTEASDHQKEKKEGFCGGSVYFFFSVLGVQGWSPFATQEK